MIYGDGDPVAMSLGEWRQIYGMHDIVAKAGSRVRRMLADASMEAARVHERAQRATQTLLNSTASLHRLSASPVPEPASGSLLMLATVTWLLRRRHAH